MVIDKEPMPIYTFLVDGYFGRACAYDRQTTLYLLREDEKLIRLVSMDDLEKIVKLMIKNKLTEV